jgi:hypothetical protein
MIIRIRIRATRKWVFWLFVGLSQILRKLQTVEQNIAKYLRAAAALAMPPINSITPAGAYTKGA